MWRRKCLKVVKENLSPQPVLPDTIIHHHTCNTLHHEVIKTRKKHLSLWTYFAALDLKTFHKDAQIKKGTIGVAIRNVEGSVTLRMTKNSLRRASKLSMPFIDNKDYHWRHRSFAAGMAENKCQSNLKRCQSYNYYYLTHHRISKFVPLSHWPRSPKLQPKL